MDTVWTGQCAWSSSAAAAEAEGELRRGPWTVEEDAVLAGHVVAHGEGRWNELARAAGLRRTGKSCRLRWLNYLRPGVRRGDFTPQEQLLILELHLRWGNRWSRIAQHMPGRTDNEIKNYWRTRVQKHAKQLNCDVNSSQFHDVMRRLWMPRLVERIHAAAAAAAPPMTSSGYDAPPSNQLVGRSDSCHSRDTTTMTTTTSSTAGSSSTASVLLGEPQFTSMTNQLVTASSDGGVTDWSSSKQCGSGSWSAGGSVDLLDGSWSELLARSYGDDGADSLMLSGTADLELGESGDNWWSLEDIWLHQQY